MHPNAADRNAGCCPRADPLDVMSRPMTKPPTSATTFGEERWDADEREDDGLALLVDVEGEHDDDETLSCTVLVLGNSD